MPDRFGPQYPQPSSASWSNSAPQMLPPSAVQPPPPARKGSFWGGVFVGFLVAALVAGGVWFFVNRTPDIAEAARNAGLSSGVSGNSYSETISPYAVSKLKPLFTELGFPASTMDRISKTRPLDGTLEARGDGVVLHWSYNADDGLFVSIDPDGG